jgi:MFS family permease
MVGQTENLCGILFYGASNSEKVMQNAQQNQMVRRNFIFNILDGSFFGLSLGFASYVTIIPLFMASLTDSTILIGLVATLNALGWQLPQLFTAERVSRLRKYRPMVLMMTLQERVPWICLAILALATPHMNKSLAVVLAIVLITWQSMGGGLTATPWQSMIAKIFPATLRGTFYGVQSGATNFMASVGAFVAGGFLVALPYPYNFAACFGTAGLAMFISLGFLSKTQEIDHEIAPTPQRNWREVILLLKNLMVTDSNFAWYILARMLAQLSQMGLAFYTIYALREYGVDAHIIGLFTGVMMLTQMLVSPIMGWVGDKFGHRSTLAIGDAAMALSAMIALFAPGVGWFYVVFVLTGIVNSTAWTSILAISSEFGNTQTRPYYVGLSNTLIAPVTLLAPILGGWLADFAGFEVLFVVCVVIAFVAGFIMLYCVEDPRHLTEEQPLYEKMKVAPAHE